MYVASGQTYPDALAGGAVAGAQDSSVLLVKPGAIPAAVRTELQRLRPDRIVVLGGTASVSSRVETDLRNFAGALERVHGGNRYATSVHLAQEAFSDGADTAFLASGQHFPDALSGAPAARVNGAPVLLVQRSADRLRSAPPCCRRLRDLPEGIPRCCLGTVTGSWASRVPRLPICSNGPARLGPMPRS